jgi:transposase
MVTMSQKEFQRVKVIENVAGGRLSVREASRLLQLSERQVQRLKRRYQPDSVGWVQHGNRGRSMPWAVSIPQKQLILRLARGKYQGFNDSHLAEKLRAQENLSVSRETVRRILRAAKLASPQKRRPRRYRSRRPPRPRFGMMVLTDASRHDWLEGRGPQLTLVGFQDDATSQILAARFQLEPENTLGYLRLLHTMITAHGLPLSLYRDRHNIFQRNDAHWTAEELSGKQSPTQLGRALQELGIEQIPAYSPQAKGRIERAWRTCQDRLVSELRLAHATTLLQVNTVLQRFCAEYNRRFAHPAAEAACDFRALPRRFNLARCLSLHYQRVVGADHVIRLGAHAIALPALPGQRGYARETVELAHQLDGLLCVYRGDQLLLTLPLGAAETQGEYPISAIRHWLHEPAGKPCRQFGFNSTGFPANAR